MSSQVPESEKYGLSFGSFESSYSQISISVNALNMSESYKSETASEQAEESAQESSSR
jgi:hypothetical protein